MAKSDNDQISTPRRPIRIGDAGLWLSSLLHSFISDRRGATAVEYGMLTAGIALSIIVIVLTLGEDIADHFQALQQELHNAPANF